MQMQNSTATAPRHSSSSTKLERKVMEKNRRNIMKDLHSKLNSLLPNQTTPNKPLIDQIDETINYIKSLEENLKKCEEKKESLTKRSSSSSRKRSLDQIGINASSSNIFSKPPKLEIRETGSALEIVLISGIDNQFLFHDIIRILHNEAVEVVTANFQVSGSSVRHVVHAQISSELTGTYKSAKVTERLNRFINGSKNDDDLALDSKFWDAFDIHPDPWGLLYMKNATSQIINGQFSKK